MTTASQGSNPAVPPPSPREQTEFTAVAVSRWHGWLLVATGLLGTAASVVLTVDKFRLLADPSYVPGCSINAQFSCGTVMTSWQSSLFGFPNSIIGVLCFPVVATLGALIVLRVRLPLLVWWALQGGVLFAVVFVHWLIVQSVFVIGALCLYCMVVWIATIPLFWFTTLITLANDPGRLSQKPSRLTWWQIAIPAGWLAAVAAIIAVEIR